MMIRLSKQKRRILEHPSREVLTEITGLVRNAVMKNQNPAEPVMEFIILLVCPDIALLEDVKKFTRKHWNYLESITNNLIARVSAN